MPSLNNNNNYGKGNHRPNHDGQKNYAHSNQKNPDNVRNATRDHEYRDNEELTNDANFEPGNSAEMDFRDKNENVDKHEE
ncbi:hypothetical protein [Flavobacterium pallidum]|uniref:Uncharacterized protein n=1 Tax=Flavobacterium pallidum TaxID=2172098 RepID=A0A2S1SJ87_9FLAO|nr:hypothetical protein [Flavobacterium pallidum]AWI26451.1 hypothetical protein HYN49_11360 [Flavobacterium pallidum]